MPCIVRMYGIDVNIFTCGSELVKVWSALTLLGSYNGCLCVFRVEQVISLFA